MKLRRTQVRFLEAATDATSAVAVADFVLPSKTLSPRERLDIYSRSYFARLEECLVADFPVVKALLGERRFHGLVHDYVEAHPPSSWTLARLGDEMPTFLAKRRGVSKLVRDVARLERAMSEAFDAEVAETLSSSDVARVPTAAWAKARLVPSESLRVLAFETAANAAVVSVLEKDVVPKKLPRGPSFVAVYRKDWRVWRMNLTRPMHAALSALAGGRPLGAAVAAASRVFEGDPDELAPLVSRWFATWVEEGVFAAVAR